MSKRTGVIQLARYAQRLSAGCPPAVSVGDAWFDYPFYPNAIDHLHAAELFAHLRLEKCGDTMQEVAGDSAAREALVDVVIAEQPVCVLVSAGLNDIAASAPLLFHQAPGDDPYDFFHWPAVDELFRRLTSWYSALAESIGPYAPVIAHGYDYFTPSDRPVRFNGVRLGSALGPWIYPAMVGAGIDDNCDDIRRHMARILVDRFNDMLATVAAERPHYFVHANLRGTLDADTDWQNEMHPTRAGFVKVAARLAEVMAGRMPNLLDDQQGERLMAQS